MKMGMLRPNLRVVLLFNMLSATPDPPVRGVLFIDVVRD